jgi:hypothetical protein
MSTEVDAFVWYNLDGTIVAVGHVSPGQEEHIEPTAKPHQRVLRVRAQREHLNTLHMTHRIDLIAGVLRARGESAGESRVTAKTKTEP